MIKLYHLSSCNTCQRIIKELHLPKQAVLQDIKKEPITNKQLANMKILAGSYEALFSRKARKYRQEGLHEQTLTENEYRDWILKEYTFLKRPVLLVDDQIFIGNTPKAVEAAKVALSK